jgi:hypothetical protein
VHNTVQSALRTSQLAVSRPHSLVS